MAKSEGASIPRINSAREDNAAADKFLKCLRERLESEKDERLIAKGQKFFRGTLKGYGIEGGTRRVASFVTDATRDCGGQLNFASRMRIAERLFSSGMYEEGQAAAILLKRQAKHFDGRTVATFERWIDEYIDNWGVCDSFCTGVVFQAFERFPERIKRLLSWGKSKNPWLRRAACATMTRLCRRGAHIQAALQLMDALIPKENDPLVQKGMGWVLKVLSVHEPQTVVNYLKNRAAQIPSVMRRPAMELLPAAYRSQVMDRRHR